MRAECCDDCGPYQKVVQMDKDAHAEPVADDLVSLTFDDPDALPPPGAP